MPLPLPAEWRAGLDVYSDADWESDKATRRSVSAGVIMRGGHCLKRWTKKQQVVSLSSAESELYAAVKAASEGLGVQSLAKDLGMTCGLNLHLDASATMCLVSRRGLGKAKHVDMQNLWIQEASKSGRFVTKKVGTNVNPADMMTMPLPRPKVEQLMSLMGYEFMRTDAVTRKGSTRVSASVRGLQKQSVQWCFFVMRFAKSSRTVRRAEW